jgi:hypothetical protein
LHSTAKGLVLQVIKAGGALYVGQGLAGRDLVPLEDLAAAERPFELADKLFQVVLHHAVEVDHVAVDVVDDFDLGGLAQKVKGCAARKHLDVAGVGWEAAQDGVGKTAFAAKPGDDGGGHCECFGTVKLFPPPGRWQGLGWLTAVSWIGGWLAVLVTPLAGRPVFTPGVKMECETFQPHIPGKRKSIRAAPSRCMRLHGSWRRRR